MDAAALLSHLKRRASGAEEVPPKDKWLRDADPQVRVPAAQVADAAGAALDLGFDLLNFVTAVDWAKEDRLEMVYHFTKSADPAQKFYLKADLPRAGEPSLPSLALLYSSADWQERETYDLFGIRFNGHPNLKRILLWEGYPGWPLRKDYVHTQDRYDNGSEIGLPKPAADAPGGPPK